MILTGTTIVIMRKEDEIVLGADSKVTSYANNGSPLARPPRCKIKQVGSIFYGFSGMSNHYLTGFSADNLARDSITNTDTIKNAIKHFETVTREKLREAVNHIKVNNPDQYRLRMVHNQAAIVMAGFENGFPTVALLNLYAKKYLDSFRIYTLRDYLDSNDPRKRVGTFIGDGKAIVEYTKNRRGFWHDDPIGAARIMLELQAEATPETVGEPFSIVRITQAGAEWIEKGICE
jgi:hypothetical protein